MVTGPEVAQQIFNQVESKDKTFVYMVTPWLGNGLVFSEGAIWKRNRKLLTPTFYYQSLINFVKIMNKSSDRMIEVINRDSNGKDPIEFVPLIHNMTLEVILNCICSKGSDLQLNIDTNSREMTYVEGLEKIRQGMEERFSSFFSMFDIIFYRKNVGKEFARGAKMTKQYIVSLIQEREENPREESDKSDYDMLDLLTRSRDEEGNGLTQKEIIDELNTFVFAGHDTTGAASSFVFYHLAKYPELQEKCREEVLSVMGGRDEIEWKDIAKFTYLTCFIKETMRLYPPVMFISKMLNKPFTIDGHKIPANVSLDISPSLIHKNAKHWPDPDKFDPSRFNGENIEKHHPYAFIPFSAGSRNCIGQNFAMSEIKIITAKLLKKFQVSLQDGYDIDITVKVILSPSDNLPLVFRPLW
ncbi:Cytochrome P450 4B1 [Oopsacas minuta]|uniref:Cytochrome P450 4B1 n=1 Tax=Oopsacas minuta TaxID=111878 RepID=A0AAV7K9A0_9METZ|nr:Cytochrome P450 4B1 [Oopsacas minuta]